MAEVLILQRDADGGHVSAGTVAPDKLPQQLRAHILRRTELTQALLSLSCLDAGSHSIFCMQVGTAWQRSSSCSVMLMEAMSALAQLLQTSRHGGPQVRGKYNAGL